MNKDYISPQQIIVGIVNNSILCSSSSLWNSYKKNYPQKALELEALYGSNFSQLCDDDVRQRIKSVERATTVQKCQISQLKRNLLQLFDKMIPEIGEDEGRKILLHGQEKDMKEELIKKENSFSTLCIKWFDQYIAQRQKEIPIEQKYREQIRHSLKNKLDIMNNDDNPYINGMESFIYIKSMYEGLRKSDSTEAMDVILKAKGLSAYDILEEEIDAALKKYCGMDILAIQEDKPENNSKKLYHEDFVRKSQNELKTMNHIDIFKYRCKEAIIQTMIPFRHTNNAGCQSEACKILMSLANQMSNNTELMATALVYGYGGEFHEIIYDETNKALQSYCGVSIDDVRDYNEEHKE